jgi:hypothetical protein
MSEPMCAMKHLFIAFVAVGACSPCYADTIIECRRVPYAEASKINGKTVAAAIGCSYDGKCCDLKDYCDEKDGTIWCYLSGVKPE